MLYTVLLLLLFMLSGNWCRTGTNERGRNTRNAARSGATTRNRMRSFLRTESSTIIVNGFTRRRLTRPPSRRCTGPTITLSVNCRRGVHEYPEKIIFLDHFFFFRYSSRYEKLVRRGPETLIWSRRCARLFVHRYVFESFEVEKKIFVFLYKR